MKTLTICLLLLTITACSDTEAMKKCQEKYSYDTCFHILNN
jgi:hypothetical protein